MNNINKKYVIIGVVVVFLLWCFAGYNGLVAKDENVDNAWAQVEVQLQRRYDLIPNLVRTVKGYAAHEKEVFVAITEARSKVGAAKTTNDKVAANNQLEGALARLMVVVEAYPTLQANRNFLKLQDQLEGTENRISVARKRYNDSVNSYNKSRRRFPTVIIGAITGFDSKKERFQAQAAAAENPEVSF